MYWLKRIAIIVTGAILMFDLVSCGYLVSGDESGNSVGSEVENTIDTYVYDKISDSYADEGDSEDFGDYKYPENPANQLREALENAKNERGLPIRVGNVGTVEIDGKECTQLKIDFANGNICVISFTNKYIVSGYEETLDGNDNPSFTMAFKDSDNSQDMVMILTSVIKYISPNLSLKEAERLAAKQDYTISTDGYAMPQDIGGYQIQARYTNPHTFVSTSDFDAMLGVNIRAIKQMWRGRVDPKQCHELASLQDFNLLNVRYWEEEKHPEVVYADFIVTNTWQGQSYLHGETWVVVDVESMHGEKYSLCLDTWEYPNAYEFGVGQKYTLFIRLNFSGGIIYAVQQSESAELNSRGEVQPIDYPVVDWQNPIRRIEPEGEGTFHDVSFILASQSYGDQFPALHGYGLGEKQWPNDPVWDGYTFVGWYDNLEWKGNPYTKDTPIYQDTHLYAKWFYSGAGGVWPRAYIGNIQGINKDNSFPIGQKITITADGYNMNLDAPKDQRFRWYPVSWKLADSTSGNFSSEAPFQLTLELNDSVEQVLYITYTEEVFDGLYWQETGQSQEVPEVTFKVE